MAVKGFLGGKQYLQYAGLFDVMQSPKYYVSVVACEKVDCKLMLELRTLSTGFTPKQCVVQLFLASINKPAILSKLLILLYIVTE